MNTTNEQYTAEVYEIIADDTARITADAAHREQRLRLVAQMGLLLDHQGRDYASSELPFVDGYFSEEALVQAYSAPSETDSDHSNSDRLAVDLATEGANTFSLMLASLMLVSLTTGADVPDLHAEQAPQPAQAQTLLS